MKVIIAATATLLFATLSVNAQVPIRGNDFPVACPHPINTTINLATNPPAPLASDFGPVYNAVQSSQWNQTTPDKAFGTSVHIPPVGKECCVWTSATVTLTIKALQTGAFNSSTSGNDGINIMSNGVSVAGTPAWPNGATAGGTRSVTLNVPASALQQSTFGVYVQDDTAVTSVVVRLQGCCIH